MWEGALGPRAGLWFVAWHRAHTATFPRRGDVAGGFPCGRVAGLPVRRSQCRLLSRSGFLIPDPPPDCAQPPVVSVVDLNRLGERESPKLLSIQQAPNVHLTAIAEQLAQLPAGDQAFVVEPRDAPQTMRHRILLKHSLLSEPVWAGITLPHLRALRFSTAVCLNGVGLMFFNRA
jgi:hypothetical protein